MLITGILVTNYKQELFSKYHCNVIVTTVFSYYPYSGYYFNKKCREYEVFSSRKIVSQSLIQISRNSFLWKNYEWTFLRSVHNTCRRGPHLCPCSPQLPKSKLVERTSGVSRPLTCYRCQQGCTNSLEKGRIRKLNSLYQS